MKAPYESAINGFTSLISEFITDDDLKNKLNFETDKLRFELDKVLLSTTTSPRIDAFVKILIAMRDIIIPMLRPVGSLLMAGFGAYCVSNNIELSDTMMTILFGAPVAWGTSRHINKKDHEKTKRSQSRPLDHDDDFDD